MNDIPTAESVEVTYDANTRTLWVNVDGSCALRVQRIQIQKRSRLLPESGGCTLNVVWLGESDSHQLY